MTLYLSINQFKVSTRRKKIMEFMIARALCKEISCQYFIPTVKHIFTRRYSSAVNRIFMHHMTYGADRGILLFRIGKLTILKGKSLRVPYDFEEIISFDVLNLKLQSSIDFVLEAYKYQNTNNCKFFLVKRISARNFSDNEYKNDTDCLYYPIY